MQNGSEYTPTNNNRLDAEYIVLSLLDKLSDSTHSNTNTSPQVLTTMHVLTRNRLQQNNITINTHSFDTVSIVGQQHPFSETLNKKLKNGFPVNGNRVVREEKSVTFGGDVKRSYYTTDSVSEALGSIIDASSYEKEDVDSVIDSVISEYSHLPVSNMLCQMCSELGEQHSSRYD